MIKGDFLIIKKKSEILNGLRHLRTFIDNWWSPVQNSEKLQLLQSYKEW